MNANSPSRFTEIRVTGQFEDADESSFPRQPYLNRMSNLFVVRAIIDSDW
jgi:hypothetical protein